MKAAAGQGRSLNVPPSQITCEVQLFNLRSFVFTRKNRGKPGSGLWISLGLLNWTYFSQSMNTRSIWPKGRCLACFDLYAQGLAKSNRRHPNSAFQRWVSQSRSSRQHAPSVPYRSAESIKRNASTLYVQDANQLNVRDGRLTQILGIMGLASLWVRLPSRMALYLCIRWYVSWVLCLFPLLFRDRAKNAFCSPDLPTDGLERSASINPSSRRRRHRFAITARHGVSTSSNYI